MWSIFYSFSTSFNQKFLVPIVHQQLEITTELNYFNTASWFSWVFELVVKPKEETCWFLDNKASYIYKNMFYFCGVLLFSKHFRVQYFVIPIYPTYIGLAKILFRFFCSSLWKTPNILANPIKFSSCLLKASTIKQST